MQAVADGAAIDVDVGPGGEVGGVGLHVCADHFALNARFEGDVDELAFVGEGWIGDGNGDFAVFEIHDHSERNQDESDDQAKDEAHVVLRPPVVLIVEHGNG